MNFNLIINQMELLWSLLTSHQEILFQTNNMMLPFLSLELIVMLEHIIFNFMKIIMLILNSAHSRFTFNLELSFIKLFSPTLSILRFIPSSQLSRIVLLKEMDLINYQVLQDSTKLAQNITNSEFKIDLFSVKENNVPQDAL